jgi:hypothetical protein
VGSERNKDQKKYLRVSFLNVAEELEQMWGNFSLSEKEGLEVEVPEEKFIEIVEKGRVCLVGRLMSERAISKDIIRKKLIRWWRPLGQLVFKVLGKNTFLLNFEYQEDKDRVMEGRPWTFEGSLFFVVDFDPNTDSMELNFNEAELWVRMFKLSLACMGREMGKRLGSVLGEVVASGH